MGKREVTTGTAVARAGLRPVEPLERGVYKSEQLLRNLLLTSRRLRGRSGAHVLQRIRLFFVSAGLQQWPFAPFRRVR